MDVQVLQKGLPEYFEDVSVSIVTCPDLTKEPFFLASKGLCGSTRVVEVGGVSYFMPLYNPHKVYDLKYMNRLLDVEPAAVMGTGAGPFLTSEHICCELLTNAVISNGHVNHLNTIAKISEDNESGYELEFLPKEMTKFMLMSNLFVSNGKPGEVLKIHCKRRKSKEDFPAAVRKCLTERFTNQPIGLGGVFIVEGSKVRQHIPPKKFSTEPITSQAQLNNWLRFFDMNPPLVFLGTILTHDMDMEMILQHFHSFSKHGDGGHYHYDINPETVEYQAYFNLAEKAVHIDRPAYISDLKVDDIIPNE